MRTLLIAAADESMVSILMKLIRVNEINYSICGIANNIIDVEDLICKVHPDVLIIDEALGHRSDFFEKLSGIQNICVIVLTDFAGIFRDYTVLDKMMFEYIYKPIKKEQAINVLKRESLESEKEQKYRVFTEMRLNKLKSQFVKAAIEDADYFKTRTLNDINDEYEMDNKEGSFYAVCVVLDGIEWVQERENSIVLYHIVFDIFSAFSYADEFASYQFGKYFIVLFNNLYNLEVFTDCVEDICKAIIKVNPMMYYTITISKPYDTIQKIGAAIEEALHLTRKRLEKGKNQQFSAKDYEKGVDYWKQVYTTEEKNKLRNLIDVGEIALFEKWYYEMIQQMKMGPDFSIDSVFSMAEELYMQFKDYLRPTNHISKEIGVDIKNEYTFFKENVSTVEELEKGLYQFSYNCIYKITILRQRPDQRIQDIQKYVWRHYMDDINLVAIAKEVQLSPNYLCCLFKKRMKITLVEYLNTYRINRAKEMLIETDMTLQEMAPLIGFTDVKYFSRTFKKYVGVPPSRYRMKNKWCSGLNY